MSHAETSEHNDHGDSHGHHAVDTEHLKPAIGIDPKTFSTSFLHPDGGIITYLNKDLPEASKRVDDWNDAIRENRVYRPEPEHHDEVDTPTPTSQATDEASEQIAAGLLGIGLPAVEPSEDFQKALLFSKRNAEKAVRDAYAGLEDVFDHVTDDKIADYTAVQDDYQFPSTPQKAVSLSPEAARNVQEQLVAHGHAIEGSYKARLEALASGKPIQEADAIGADVYKEISGMDKKDADPEPQPEPSPIIEPEAKHDPEPAPSPVHPEPAPQPTSASSESGTTPEPTPGPSPRTSSDKEKLTPEERKEALKAKQEALKKWFRKIGHNAMLNKKAIDQIGLGNILHYKWDKKTEAILTAGQKAVDSIEQSPDRLVKQFKAALETFKHTSQQFKAAWTEGYTKARERKSVRREEKNRMSPADQATIDARAEIIFKYLGEKHPDRSYGPTSTT